MVKVIGLLVFIGVSVIVGTGDACRVAVGSGVSIACVAVACAVAVGATRVLADWQATTNDARPITIPIRCTNLLRNEVIVTLFCE
jgi:hypothetical protein